MTRNGRLPLSRFTVLDLTAHRAGPTCVRQLADWGADVIKIEAPNRINKDKGGIIGARHGFDFQNLHRNKRGLTLNLKSKMTRWTACQTLGGPQSDPDRDEYSELACGLRWG